MFLPNGSLFYNTETKRLHAGIVDANGALSEPGPELGPFTFNVVEKTNPWGSWVVWLIPGLSKTFPVQNFPTIETVGKVLTIVRTKFPEIKWNYIGNPFTPADMRDQVQLIGTNEAGKSESFSIGEIASNIMRHGEAQALASFGLEIKDAFSVDLGS